MPTENPRVTITMSEEQLDEIRNYLHENKMKNQTQAILSLINKGFDALNSTPSEAVSRGTKKAPTKSVSALEDELLDNFRRLDTRGQTLLCELSNAMVDSGRYVSQMVDFAARGGQHATVNPVDDLDSLLPPEDSSDI